MPTLLSSCARRLAVAFLFLAMVVGAGTARAADGPATKVVRGANETIAAQLKAKAPPGSDAENKATAKVTESVRGFLDIDELARRAMVDHWAKISDAQKKDFLTLLRGLIEDNYVKGLRANLDYQVNYLGEEPAAKKAGEPDTTLVKTAIVAKKKGRPVTIEVDYKLVSQGGKLRAYDVATDGVSLIENYRAQFNKIIATDGVDGLLERMRKKRGTMATK